MHVKWHKQGLVYSVEGQSEWAHSHTHKPTPLLVDAHTLRIYFGVRGTDGRTRTTFIDVDPDDPLRVLRVAPIPILDLGRIGAFDDSGANVCSVIRKDDLIYMYYIGWNPSTTVHTRNSIGVAISTDGGETFERAWFGPILDRNRDEPYYTGAVEVMPEHGRFRMWYTSVTEWVMINGKPEIRYHIKYAESPDGIDWRRPGISCIPPNHPEEATARPSVLRIGDEYLMWYSRRHINGFRSRRESMYRAGFARSKDGIAWVREDDLAGIEPSGSGWDGDAIAYPYAIYVNGRLMLFYNGNDFGRSGFGYAIGEVV
ncbi:MAG TPA: hypothetical protein VFH71_13555 [Rhodanobacteraceae bacterium]|nr:hypothetical protein [Rhodanobacteraceae bacterium]